MVDTGGAQHGGEILRGVGMGAVDQSKQIESREMGVGGVGLDVGVGGQVLKLPTIGHER